MAVKIRMKRVGTKNTPVFRIVVADGRSPRDGKCIEEVGTYQPLKKGSNFSLKQDRVPLCLIRLNFPQAHSQSRVGPKMRSQKRPPASGLNVLALIVSGFLTSPLDHERMASGDATEIATYST